MEERVLTHTIEILESDPDFFVPIKKLWTKLREEKILQDLSLDDFSRQLQADQRFEFTPGVDYREGFNEDADLAAEMETEMESLGFFSGPRVKLSSREMSATDVFAAMSRSLQRMNTALQGAWDTRPPGDEALESQLLDILAVGQRMEREICELLDQAPDQEPE